MQKGDDEATRVSPWQESLARVMTVCQGQKLCSNFLLGVIKK